LRRCGAWVWWLMRTPRSARDVNLDRVAGGTTTSLASAVEFCSSHFTPKSRRYRRGRGDVRSASDGEEGEEGERGGERGSVTGAARSHTRCRGYEIPPWPSPPPSPPAMATSFPSPRAPPRVWVQPRHLQRAVENGAFIGIALFRWVLNFAMHDPNSKMGPRKMGIPLEISLPSYFANYLSS
jgi:hypothetical protein